MDLTAINLGLCGLFFQERFLFRERVMHLLDLSHQRDEVFNHQNGRHQISQLRQGFGQAFIIPRQATKPRGPAKTAFYHPTARQQNKALHHLHQLDLLQF